MKRWGLACLGLAGLLVACQSIAVPPAVAEHPADLASALVLARSEAEAGHWGRAWVLASNQAGSSEEKAALQGRILGGLEDQLQKALAEGQVRRSRDLEATLTLIRTGRRGSLASGAAETVSPSTPDQWLKGTATVVVNRGLKTEHGTSQPDIVIGSGFFLTPDGLLLTNHHVIESEVEPTPATSSRLSVRLPGSKGERLPARVVGWDKNLDLALLKVEYKPEFVFALSEAGDPVPGQRLQALGSPGGLEASLTEGIVSSSARPLLALGEVLQIDAAVNPGNSGGPLVDAQGRVVGVVFAGIRDFQGVNFAIPASLVQKVLPLLKAGGRIVLPWLGLGLAEDTQGLEVVYVVPRGPADEAGVKVGDRLTAVAATPVRELAAAQVLLLDFGTEAVLPLDLTRSGTALRLWSTLGARPDLPLKDAAMKDLASRVFPLAFGAQVEDTARGVDRTFLVRKVWPGSAAEELSLSENDPIEVLDWVADPKNEVLVTQWKIKRRLGGWLESTVQLAVPYSSRFFL